MPTFEQVGLFVGWFGLIATAFATVVGGIRALLRGPKEDKSLESDIQDRVTAMAERWLKVADARLVAVEEENAKLRTKVETLEYAKKFELRQRQQMIDHVAAVHSWIEGGAKPPPPDRPTWAPGNLTLEALADQEITNPPGSVR